MNLVVYEERQELQQVVDYFKSTANQEMYIEALAKERKLKPETLLNADCFFVPEDMPTIDIPEFIMKYSHGLYRRTNCTMAGRLVYPVKDVQNQIMGFCGWDKFVKPKYRDSDTLGYKAKAYTLFGMEMLPMYYNDTAPVFVTEGIVDTLWLRENNFLALASLGSHLTKYVVQILNRFGRRLVVIPDNDEAGDSFARQVFRELPMASIIQAKVGKDVDGMRQVEGIDVNSILADLKSFSFPLSMQSNFIRRR